MNPLAPDSSTDPSADLSADRTLPAGLSVVGRRRRVPFLLIVSLLVAVWVLAILFRWELRAEWWVYQAARAESRQDRDFYITRLASIQDKSLRVVPRLLNDPRPEVREGGVHILRFCQNPAAADLLIARLADADPEVVAVAATALARRSDASTYVARLSRSLTAGRNDLASWGLVVALGRIGGATAEQTLLDRLSAPDNLPEIRAQLIDSLGMSGCTQAVPLIEEALGDTRSLQILPQSQLSARRAIASMGSQLAAHGANPLQALASVESDATVAAVAAHWIKLLGGPAIPASTSQATQ